MKGVNLDNLADALERMSEQMLNRFTRRCICQSVHDVEAGVAIDVSCALDVIYTEYARRGLEKHYDMVMEVVAKNPELCDAA